MPRWPLYSTVRRWEIPRLPGASRCSPGCPGNSTGPASASPLSTSWTRPTPSRCSGASPTCCEVPFRQHLQIGPWSGSYARFIDALIAAGDDDLLDHVAARIVTRTKSFFAKTDLLAEADRLAEHYAAMKPDEVRFSRRAASVLGRIPAFTIPRYGKLIRENRLARLLFERSAAAYLADARSVQDLVEGSEIHVMALAYRILGVDDDRARTLAAENLTPPAGDAAPAHAARHP